MAGTRITVGPCRISYPNLFKPKGSKDFPEQGERFSCDILIPKANQAMVNIVMAAINEAVEDGKERFWKDTVPKGFRSPLKDGDERDDANYKGHWILSPWSSADRRPNVLDMSLQPIIDQTEIYGGMWANVSVDFYAYDNRGKGVGCGFDAGVQKVKDDEAFGGGTTSAEAAFGPAQAVAPTAFAQPQMAVNPVTGLPYGAPAQAAPVVINPITGLPM